MNEVRNAVNDNKELDVLIEALKASLFGYSPDFPDDVDWNKVIEEAEAQTVLGIISPVIPVQSVITKQRIANYIRILYEQDKLIKLLDENDIPCVILKGCAAAIYYPQPHLRAMGDVDFLVERDKFEKAVSVLEANGYKYLHGKDEDGRIDNNIRHIEYTKNGIEYELHHHFSSAGFDIDDILEEAINRRVYRELGGYKIPMLPDAENGLVLLGHINQHLKNSALGLRQIIDWEMFFHKVMDNDKWHSEFMPLTEQSDLNKLAVSVTKMCESYLGLPSAVTFDETIDEEHTRELLDMILTDGNFGRKAAVQLPNNEKKLISCIYEIKQEGFINHFQIIGLGTWPLCNKYSFLKPFAWIYGLMRHTIRGMVPLIKSKNIKKNLDEVARRERLFNDIGVNIK